MIHQVYQRLRDAGFTHSQVHFSSIWPGRSPRYYSHLLATKRAPGIGTLSTLNGRLFRVALNSHCPQHCEVLCDLVALLDEEIFRRSIPGWIPTAHHSTATQGNPKTSI